MHSGRLTITKGSPDTPGELFHNVQVCFYAMRLERIQRHRPETANVLLADLIASGVVSTVRLTGIFRRAPARGDEEWHERQA